MVSVANNQLSLFYGSSHAIHQTMMKQTADPLLIHLNERARLHEHVAVHRPFHSFGVIADDLHEHLVVPDEDDRREGVQIVLRSHRSLLVRVHFEENDGGMRDGQVVQNGC